MKLLNQWRDEVLLTAIGPKLWWMAKSIPKSLMLNCMKCHTSKKQFCDTSTPTHRLYRMLGLPPGTC